VSDQRREDLERVRAGLWAAFDGGRVLSVGVDKAGDPIVKEEAAAPLANALVKVIEAIAALPQAEQGSKVDEIRAARERRRGASAADSSSAARRSQPRRGKGVHRAS
jgi:hypothetical protein